VGPALASNDVLDDPDSSALGLCLTAEPLLNLGESFSRSSQKEIKKERKDAEKLW
jgi:hypothetical protein